MTKRTKFFFFANACAVAAVGYASLLPTRLIGTSRYQKPVVVPNPKKAPFLITKLRDGAQLSGETAVEVAVFSRYADVSDVTLYVDGKEHSSAPCYCSGDSSKLRQTPIVISSRLGTEEFKNGVHVITMRDERGFVQRRKVRFYNEIHSVYTEDLTTSSPDIYKGTIADTKKNGHWIVAYSTEAGARKVFAGKGPEIRVVFYGRGIINGSQVFFRDVQIGSTRADALKKAELSLDTVVSVVS